MSTGIQPAPTSPHIGPARSAIAAFVVTVLALMLLDIVLGAGRGPGAPAPSVPRMQAQQATDAAAVRSVRDVDASERAVAGR